MVSHWVWFPHPKPFQVHVRQDLVYTVQPRCCQNMCCFASGWRYHWQKLLLAKQTVFWWIGETISKLGENIVVEWYEETSMMLQYNCINRVFDGTLHRFVKSGRRDPLCSHSWKMFSKQVSSFRCAWMTSLAREGASDKIWFWFWSIIFRFLMWQKRKVVIYRDTRNVSDVRACKRDDLAPNVDVSFMLK